MHQTFINLPEPLEKAIEKVLQEDRTLLSASAQSIHTRYMSREKSKNGEYLNSFSDALAYLALRFPATYAQISASLIQVQESLASWQPVTVLDIGSGPGTGVFSAHELWPSIESATCIDVNNDLKNLGEKIMGDTQFPVKTLWKSRDVTNGIGEETIYDLVILSNVLNELDKDEAEQLVADAYKLCRGVLVIIEPGTGFGHTLIQHIAKDVLPGQLLAPFVANSFVLTKDYWVHFSQRFIRPDFQRTLRQEMRDSLHMASDWEEAKYCYVAMSKLPAEDTFWGRSIGAVDKQKGFLILPVLTSDALIQVKVMKRHKAQYNFAKELKWGEPIPRKEDIISDDKSILKTL